MKNLDIDAWSITCDICDDTVNVTHGHTIGEDDDGPVYDDVSLCLGCRDDNNIQTPKDDPDKDVWEYLDRE